MTIVEIIFAAIGCSFIVLVIYLARVLCSVNQLLKTVRKQVASLGHEPRNLLHHVNQISRGVANNVRALDPLFNAVSNVGEVLEEKSAHFAATARRKSVHKEETLSDEHGGKALDVFNWIAAGINLYKKFKKGD